MTCYFLFFFDTQDMLFVIIQNAVIDEINTKMKFTLIKFKRIVFFRKNWGMETFY
jgi:hypothetical protein